MSADRPPAERQDDNLANLAVIVPALNEEAAIEQVVLGVTQQLGATVVVVDDGSTDATGTIARRAGALVVRHPFNLGVGAAIRTGLRFAHARGFTRVLQLDGDGQHDPSDARLLLARLDQGDIDIAVGSRFGSDYKLSKARSVMMRFLSRMVTRKLGSRITDTTSGFRAFGPAAVELFARAYPTDYLSDTVEALFIAGDAGLRVAEVLVRMRPRETGQPSAGRSKSLYHLARLFLVLSIHNIRRPEVP